MTYVIDTTESVFCENNIRNRGEHFVHLVNRYLEKYIALLNKIGCDGNIIKDVQEFSQDILMCLNYYYAGSRREAYQSFEEAIKKIPINDMIAKMPLGKYYRARKPNHKRCILQKAKLFSRDEMFHIPFEKRYLVSIQRYSYPGHPCLYLGSSVNVCCEELDCFEKRLNIAEFCFCNNNLLILDMCFFDNYNFQKLTKEQFNFFTLVWPLVMICSFRYQETSGMNFRPDYIVPQMLLEYIIDSSLRENLFGTRSMPISGIRYCSVRNLSKRFENRDFNKHMNYVLPVQQVKCTGLCSALEKSFDSVRISELRDVSLY